MTKLSGFSLESTKEVISSQSGLILFGEFLNKLGLDDLCDQYLPKPGSNRGYHSSQFLQSLLLMLHAGGQYLEDIRCIEHDDALRNLLTLQVPSADTCGDWLRRIGNQSSSMRGLAQINKQLLTISMQHDRQDYSDGLTLDIDASVIASEKHAAMYTYKGFKGYTPIVGHIAENGMVIADDFRAGNIAPADNNLDFIKSCVSQLPMGQHIKYFRADAATYQGKVMSYCYDNNILYAIGGKMTDTLKETIKAIPGNQWKPYRDRDGIATGSEVAEVVWDMDTCNHSFTIVVSRRPWDNPDLFTRDDYHYHLIATNRFDDTPEQVVQWYSMRGECSENRIKELKIGFNMDYMPCGQQDANAAFFRIGTIAYNLFVMFKQIALDDSWKKSQIQTIRLHIYNIACKVVRTARNTILRVREHAITLFRTIRYQYKHALM